MQYFPHFPSFGFKEFKLLPYPAYEIDVAKLLDSVVQLFSECFFKVDQFPLEVFCNAPNRPVPETVYELNSIFLSVNPFGEDGQPACHWSQFIYQFAHEFCHYMNFGHVVQNMRWFEETLCELASHYFLIQSFLKWQIAPPYENWKSYALQLKKYQMQQAEHIASFDISKLSEQSSGIRKALEVDEYNRDYNRHIAVKLLPSFLETPSLWKIVPHLTKAKENYSFTENLLLLESESCIDLKNLLSIFGIVKQIPE